MRRLRARRRPVLRAAQGRRLVSTLLGLSLLCSLVACATRQTPSDATGIPLLALSPSALTAPLSLVQQLRFERLEAAPDAPPIATLDALLEADARSVRLAGIAMGRRMLRLEWDGQRLDAQRDPQLPASADPARILRDLQLVYWPADAVRAALPADWSLVADAHARQLFQSEVLRWEVQFATDRLVIRNHAERYQLRVRSQAAAP